MTRLSEGATEGGSLSVDPLARDEEEAYAAGLAGASHRRHERRRRTTSHARRGRAAGVDDAGGAGPGRRGHPELRSKFPLFVRRPGTDVLAHETRFIANSGEGHIPAK